MEATLHYLRSAKLFEIVILGLIVNFSIYFCSISLYSLLSLIPKKNLLGEKQMVLKSDIYLSVVTVICNTIVFILGVELWNHGFVSIGKVQSGIQIFIEVFILTIVMDLLMYVFHRFVHFLSHFRQIHERHHQHKSTNLISLFVLNPVESIGFGLMILAVLFIFPFSAISISLYLLINSLWGTIGHLNHSIFPQSWLKIAKKGFACTSEFHYLHHQFPNTNFGFYSSIWDKLFKTIHPKY